MRTQSIKLVIFSFYLHKNFFSLMIFFNTVRITITLLKKDYHMMGIKKKKKKIGCKAGYKNIWNCNLHVLQNQNLILFFSISTRFVNHYLLIVLHTFLLLLKKYFLFLFLYIISRGDSGILINMSAQKMKSLNFIQ